MRLIDADKLLDMFNKKSDLVEALTEKDKAMDFYVFCKVADAIEAAPTVDAVPVVRCKDCKHHCGKNTMWCQLLEKGVKKDFFCACGERKDDDD